MLNFGRISRCGSRTTSPPACRPARPAAMRSTASATPRRSTSGSPPRTPALGLENLAFDIRYGLRQLRRSPGFALTAILTLALGVGANLVVFGVLNALLLRPLNVAGADRLVEIVQKPQGYNAQSYPDYLDYRARNTTFSDMAAYRLTMAGMSIGGAAEKCWNYEVSGNYFDMLGVQPQVGRFFHARDEHGPNSAPFIVLSDTFWRSRFSADPLVVGRHRGPEQAPLHHHRSSTEELPWHRADFSGRTSGSRWSMKNRSMVSTS